MLQNGIGVTQGVLRHGVVLPHLGLPQIVGSMVEGAVLDVVGVTWPAGTVVSRRWFRAGLQSPVATTLTYTIGSGDPDGTLFVEETGSFRGYSSKLTSAPTPIIAHGGPPLTAPQPIENPTILGDPTVGQTLTLSVGQWDANPAASFVGTWQRLVGNSWVDLVDGLTKVVATGDVDAGPNTLRGRVVATNSEGSTPAYTQAITCKPYVAPIVKPVNIEPPTITGVATEGEILTINIGVWAPTPETVVYTWYRDGAVIPNAKVHQYQTTSADVLHTIRGMVTAGNSDGTNDAVTDPTPPIKAAAPPNTSPVNTALPRLLGSPIVGNTLSISPGLWTGFPAPTFAYEVFAGTTSRGVFVGTYKVVDSDDDKMLTVRETASNGIGPDVVATSLPVGPVHTVEPSATFTLGINLSGMEYSDEGTIDVYAITIPDSQLDEVKAKGFTDIRLPVKWDRIERSEHRDVFDTVNWGNVVDAITRIGAKDLTCLLDIHNFGSRVVQVTRQQTPLNATNFLGTGWKHYGAADAADGFIEDGSFGDHDQYFEWTAEGPGTVLIAVEAKVNPAYTGNGSYKLNILNYGPGGKESGFRMSDGVRYAGSTDGYSDPTVDSDGYRTFYLPATVTQAGLCTINIGAGASSGPYSGNNYQGVAGQQPLLIRRVRADFTLSQKEYRSIGELRGDGSMPLPPEDLATTWSRIATDLRARNLERFISAYDLMNEPNNVVSPEIWFQTAQLAIYAIRATGSTIPIMVEGKPYSGTVTFPEANPNLPALIDPADNLIFSGHCYGDWDSSGAATGLPMAWSVQGGRKVEIPVNPPNDANEVVDEMTLVRRCDHMLQWLKTKGFKRLHIGELGIGRDSIHWNNQMRNLLAWAQENEVWISLWAGGPAWGDGYELRWTTYADGLQAEQMAVIDELKSNPAPTIYRTTMPFRLALNGTTLAAKVQYNGIIASPITWTPHCDQGGSFSPASITSDTTENFTGVVTFTPPANTNGQIYWTNNKGLTNPAPLPFSSFKDIFTRTEAEGISTYRVFSVWRRRYKSYTGPLVRLWKAVGGVAAEQDFGLGSGVETIDTAAIATWSAGADGGVIKVAKIYDQGPAAGLTSSSNITARQANDGGWPAPTAADYPLWIPNRGDGKPVARWTGTGTSSMDFGESMLNRSNACVIGLLKHNSGWNDLHWQFANKFMVFPSYICDRDGASYSYGQQNGTWSHFLAGRHRNSDTGTVGWLNGIEKFKAKALDNTIQTNPDGVHGPDYRDQCQMGYYRFTSGANQGSFDFLELASLSDIPTDTLKTAFWDEANTTFNLAIAAPTRINPFQPKYVIDFLTGKEYQDGVEVPAGTFFQGTKVLDHPHNGMRFNSTKGLNCGIKGAMKDAIFSDNFTFAINAVNDWVVGSHYNVFMRDNTPWITGYFERMFGDNTNESTKGAYCDITGSGDYILATPPYYGNGTPGQHGGSTPAPVLRQFFSRGRGKKISSGVAGGVDRDDRHFLDATTAAMPAAPTLIKIGDGTANTWDGYIQRIEVWDTAIEDDRDIPAIRAQGRCYGLTKGPELTTFWSGMNLSGLDFGQFFNPYNEEVDYYEKFGINLYRVPFKLHQQCPNFYANDYTIDERWAQPLADFITYATGKGAVVLLDMHEFGNPDFHPIGGEMTNAMFKGVWKAIAQRYGASNPRVHYDLMNEPTYAVQGNLASAYQAATDGIRETGATGAIHLEVGGSFAFIGGFAVDFNATGDGLLAVTDPLNNLVYHAHCYFDPGRAGSNYPGNDMTQANPGSGLYAYHNFVDWLRKNNKRGFIGEFASTTNPAVYAQQDIEVRKFLDGLYACRDVIIGWSYWSGGTYWGDYIYSAWPTGFGTPDQKDRPQMSYLSQYKGTGFADPPVLGLPVIANSPPIDISIVCGALGNTYQLDVRVDPADPQRRVVTGKYGPSTAGSTNGENNTVALVTNDAYAHGQAQFSASVGDPDSTFDKDGNAYWSTIDRGAGGGFAVQKKLSGGVTWGPRVPIMGINVDHPHIYTDIWPDSPFYNRMYAAGRGGSPTFTWSNDGWQTYHVASVSGAGRFNAGFIFGGVTAKTGEAFFAYKSAQTIAVQNGSYAGSTSDFYVIRTENGGNNWNAVYVYTTLPVQNPGEDGFWACSNVGYTPPTTALPQGRLHLVIAQDVPAGVCRGLYFTSDDLGKTWSPSGRYIGDVPGYGMLAMTFSGLKNGMLVFTWMATRSRVQRMYAIASRDNGDTWSAPLQISADWSEPADASQNRTPSQDQLYAGASLADNKVVVVWPQNIGSNTYHAMQTVLTIV